MTFLHCPICYTIVSPADRICGECGDSRYTKIKIVAAADTTYQLSNKDGDQTTPKAVNDKETTPLTPHKKAASSGIKRRCKGKAKTFILERLNGGGCSPVRTSLHCAFSLFCGNLQGIIAICRQTFGTSGKSELYINGLQQISLLVITGNFLLRSGN